MKLDVITSYLLTGINMFLRFFLIPIYIHHLGMESYGLIGFYVSLEASMVFFDFGMGVASNKLLASESKISVKTTKILNTIELIYWGVSLVIGGGIILASDFIANHWLSIESSAIDGPKMIRLMGLLFMVSWSKSLYMGFLAGQKKIFLQNKIQLGIVITQGLALYLFITQLSNKIETYFYVLIFMTIVDVSLLRYFGKASFVKKSGFAQKGMLNEFFKYSSGVALLSVLSLFAFQFDKVLVSKVFTVEDLGIYNLASVLPFAVLTLIYPITTASFPRIVNISGNPEKKKIFEDWSSIVVLIVSSFMVILYFNLPTVFSLWVGEQKAIVSELTVLVLLGIFFHTGTNMVYNLLLSNGRPRVLSVIYSSSIIVYVLTSFMVKPMTLLTIASSWVYFNIALFLSFCLALFLLEKKIALVYYKNFLVNSGLIILGGIILNWCFEFGNLESGGILKLVTYIVIFGLIGLYRMKKMNVLNG